MDAEHIAAGRGAPAAGPSPQSPPRLAVAALALAVFMAIALAPQIFNDGDTGWHIIAGRLIAATGAVPTVDPFSLTFGGKPWLAHEWLAELIMAGAFAIGGWSGLALLTAAAMAGLVLVLGLEIGRWLNGPRTLIVLLLVLIALVPFILARPHVLAWPLLALWLTVLLRAREAGRAPPLAAVLIMLVWANLHASFLFGVVLAGAFGLEALLAADNRVAVFRNWLSFGLVTLAATLATPFGFGGLLFPLQVSGMKSIPTVVEWRPTVLAQAPGFLVFLVISLFALLYRGVRVPALRLLILMAIFIMAFQAVRHQALLAIVGSLMLAAPLAASFPPAPFPPATGKGAGPSRRVLAGLFAAALLFGVGRIAIPLTKPDTPSNPVSLIAALPAALHRQPVLNSYAFGGPLIFAGIRPYIDGRVDMYGDAFTFDHLAMINGDKPAFDRAVARWGITWTILQPDSPLVAVLDASPDWQRFAADPWAVVHVRRRPAPAPASPSPPPV